MKHVHDLDGDLFAMPPGPICNRIGPNFGKPQTNHLPAVGDVIGNTRTEEWVPAAFRNMGHDHKVGWADPPFLRVVDVLSIVDGDDPSWAESIDKGCVLVTRHRDTGERLVVQVGLDLPTLVLDLPGAQPGGWAIRVEPHDHVLDAMRDPSWPTAKLDARTWSPPRFDGPPLNRQGTS